MQHHSIQHWLLWCPSRSVCNCMPDTVLLLFILLAPSDERHFLRETINWQRCNTSRDRGSEGTALQLQLLVHVAYSCLIDVRPPSVRYTLVTRSVSAAYSLGNLACPCADYRRRILIRRRKITHLSSNENRKFPTTDYDRLCLDSAIVVCFARELTSNP